jgi:hypothetical protein
MIGPSGVEYTETERLLVQKWRGLRDHVLLQLNSLDAQVISAGRCRFIDQRRRLIPERLRVIELRQLHQLGLFEKLKRADDPRPYPARPESRDAGAGDHDGVRGMETDPEAVGSGEVGLGHFDPAVDPF